jgi:hypothetical protein
MRIKFKDISQKEFLDLVKQKLNSPSIRGLLQFGISTNYSSLKNYYSDRRLLPENLFDEMCHLANLKKEDFSFEILIDNWGQARGGEKSKRK